MLTAHLQRLGLDRVAVIGSQEVKVVEGYVGVYIFVSKKRVLFFPVNGKLEILSDVWGTEL